MNISIETTELPVTIQSTEHQIYFERYVDFKIVCRPTKIPVSQLSKIFDAASAFRYLTGVFDSEQLSLGLHGSHHVRRDRGYSGV